ncbi:reticulon-4b isoform X3 [Alosa alosa]|uniref:reticulon-4b isoform X3 n=1 Tax=Alosa alosa TaxID=278164 RepID=UPI00201554BF|nr:reticulon-4b isoform X3 [Alosa alosa]
MADTEVSSTTPNEEPKVEVSQGMGDVKEPVNEAEAKVVEKEISDMAEEPIDTPQEPPMEITDLSSIPSAPEVPPETAPQAPAADSVTSTTEDATEQLTKEAVTEKAAPTAPAHTEEIAAAEPVPKTEEKAPEETTHKVEENHTQEPEVEAPVAAPVVQEPVVEEPVVVSAPPEPVVSAPPEPAPVVEEPVVVSAPPEPAPVVVEEPVIIAEEPPKVAAPVEEPIVVEPPKVEEPIPVPEPTKVEAPVEEVLPAPTAPSYEPALPAFAPSQILMQFPGVVDLLYWRDVKTTGVVFGANLLLLFSLTMCSIISVLSYVALALLSVTITFRIYKGILQAIQKSDEGHPFKLYLDKELALSEEMAHKYSDVALARINSIIIELRRLFLVEDLVDSLKFAVFMWILTYIGALFNGLTLLILGLIAVFSCPIVYEKHQTQIDHYLAMVNNQVKDIVGKVQAKVPGLKKKAE